MCITVFIVFVSISVTSKIHFLLYTSGCDFTEFCKEVTVSLFDLRYVLIPFF